MSAMVYALGRHANVSMDMPLPTVAIALLTMSLTTTYFLGGSVMEDVTVSILYDDCPLYQQFILYFIMYSRLSIM